MAFADHVKSVLLNEISSIAHNPLPFVKNPGRDFTRNRKISLQNLLEFYIGMETGNLQHELLKYFHFSTDTATVSALLQLRSKLKPATFLHLLKRFNSHFPPKTYRDAYQLIACDGSEFNIPLNESDSDSFFPPSGKSKRGVNILHAVPLYDLLSQRYLDVELQPIRKKNEFQAFCSLIDRFEPDGHIKPIFIADRRFCSYHVLAHAIEHHAYVPVRAKDVFVSRLLGQDISGQEIDVSIQRFLCRTHSKKKMQHPELARFYRYISPKVPFDYLSDDNPEYPLQLRIVRFKISEETYENIITNLPEYEFAPEESMNAVSDCSHPLASFTAAYNLPFSLYLSF